jgi:hypothetical protein
MAIWRFNPDGNLDTSFDDDNGYVIHHGAAGGNGEDVGFDTVLDGAGRILVGGRSFDGVNFDMTIWRYR